MIPFELSVLGKELDCKKYGFLENLIYEKSWIELYGEIAIKLLNDNIKCTVISSDAKEDEIAKIYCQKYGMDILKGLVICRTLKMCTISYLFEHLPIIATKEKHNVILIDLLSVTDMSDLEKLDSYCKSNNISLIVKTNCINLTNALKIGNQKWQNKKELL